MASEIPSNALDKLATSVKNIVTGQPLEQTTDADVTVKDTKVKVKDADVEVQATKKVNKTVEAQHENTTVQEEKTAPVVHEDVKSHEHEKVDTVVDKEVHQDHYHTTIQPIKDRNVLPTEHVYQENEAEREIDHRDNTAKKQSQKEAAKIHDEKVVEDTTHSKTQAPTKEHEHVHHHIHETIQPVIERETVKQKIIHTTNHIHEKEHLNDEFHKATVAPTISLAEFEKSTGSHVEAGAYADASASTAVTTKKPETRSSSKLVIEAPASEVTDSTATINTKKREAAAGDVDLQATKVCKSARLEN